MPGDSVLRDSGPGESITPTKGSIVLRRLVRRFGRVTAVDGVSLEVASGEFLALLGPSGSGKTTILMMIAGFEFPDEGSILVGGEDLTWRPPQKRDLGMVFQRTTLFPHMSVLENIAFPLKMRGVGRTEREARAREALATVRLAGLGERRPTQLSGGQQQRVAIARAIVYRPRVLLMDEPLSALDRKLREEMQLEIKHLQREIGITVVFVTHDQTEALTMADRVAVLDHGRLQQLGAPRELYETPRTPFVAGFVGETNFLPARALAAAAPGAALAVELPGGHRAQATAAEPVAAGAALRLAVRPEWLRASEEGLETRLVEAVYAGADTTLLLQGAEGIALRARLPVGEPVPPPGAVLRLAWRADSARAFGAGA